MMRLLGGELSFATTAISFGTAIIAVAAFLDRNLTEEWRARVSKLVLTGTLAANAQKPWQSVAETMSAFFRAVLQAKSAVRFIKTSVVLSLVIIFITFVY